MTGVFGFILKRNKDEDFQVFINCLKQLKVLHCDDQAKAVFNLIQTMNLNSDGNYWEILYLMI